MAAPCADLAAAPATGAGSPPLVEARSLYRFFRAGDEEVLALRGVSVAVHPGELVAVVGPSGSGKSTLLGCLAGLDEPDGGSVWLAGQRLSHQPERRRARLRARHIGVLYQDRNLLAHLSVENNVRLVQYIDGGAAATHPAVLLGWLGLAERGLAHPDELSGGELARAGLAVALANAPAVLLADEPTGELDTATEAEVLAVLRRHALTGAAIIVASHSPAVAAAADRVVGLRDGQVVS